ncbi:MAG: protein kinase, partial [Verrucomicrobiae bacterium]|nr:protein kinase [Verrucomicrobiae bacterium]
MPSIDPTCPHCDSALSPDESVDGLCPRCIAAEFLAPLGNSNGEPATADLVADYQLTREIGRGAMGIVYEARQLSLNRTVAVKTISGGRLANAESVRRFQAEAEAAARLRHPNIVSIYEVGTHDGLPFFSMNLVDGGSLSDLVEDGPMKPREAAGVLHTISRAVHAAHAQGIVHRDLKPSNILLDASGAPFVSDFGLAKRIDDDAGLTLAGGPLGTPHYLPPEQAGGITADDAAITCGPPADVYSLGAILYHLLTGRPPFLAETIQATLEQVRTTDPAEPSRVNPGVPRDLETICLKCLQKDVARRYGSAADLAADLERFLAGRPIVARPVSGLEHLLSWARRNPAIASLGALAAALFVAGFAGVLWQWSRAEKLAGEESRQRTAAEASVRQLHLDRAEEHFRANQPGAGLAHMAHLHQLDPADSAVVSRLLWEMTYRKYAVPLAEPDLLPLSADVVVPPVFANAETVLSLTLLPSKGEVRLHPGGTVVGTVDLPAAPVAAEMADSGTSAIIACADGHVLGVHLSEARVTARWRAGKGIGVSEVQMSDDGETAMIRTDDGTLMAWNPATGQVTARHELGKSLRLALLAGNGRWISTTLRSDYSRALRLWSTSTNDPIGPPIQTHGRIRYITRSLADDSLLVATDRSLETWSTPDCTLIGSIPNDDAVTFMRHGDFGLASLICRDHRSAEWWTGLGYAPAPHVFPRLVDVNAAVISPGGTLFAARNRERAVHLQQLETDSASAMSSGPFAPVPFRQYPEAVVFSPDGKRLAVRSGRDLTVFQLDRPPAHSLFVAADTTEPAIYADDNGRLALQEPGQQSFRLWEPNIAPDRFMSLPLPSKFPKTNTVSALGRRGEWMAVAEWQGRISIWKVNDQGTPQKQHAEFNSGLGMGIRTLDFDSKAERLVIGTQLGGVHVFDVSSGKQPHETAPTGPAVQQVIGPSAGDRFIVIRDGVTEILTLHRNGSLQSEHHFDFASSHALCSPDGNHCVVVDPRSSEVTVLGPDGSQSRLTLDARCLAAAISTDSRLLALGLADRSAKVVRLKDAAVMATLQHGSEVGALRFTSDSSRLATGTGSGSVRVWEATTGVPVTGTFSQSGSIRAMQFAPGDATLLVVADHARDNMAAAQFCHCGFEVCERGMLGCIAWATPPRRRSLSTFIDKLEFIMKQHLQHATNVILYIGFDVHKNSIAIACALSCESDDPQFYGSCGGSNLAVERALNRICKKFNVTKKQIRIAYEAGPTGFVLVRRLLQLGYDTIVVAPSKMERAAGEKVKTDRKDAIKIARQLRGKMLTGIYIPEAKTEAVRDLCRARTDASEDLRRDKQRLCAFLLRQGMRYDGKTNWTEAHMRYLRKMKLADPILDQILEDYLRTIDEGIKRVQMLEEKLEQVLLEWKEGAPFVNALKAFRGFQTVA